MKAAVRDDPSTARQESRLPARRGPARLRAESAGPHHEMIGLDLAGVGTDDVLGNQSRKAAHVNQDETPSQLFRW